MCFELRGFVAVLVLLLVWVPCVGVFVSEVVISPEAPVQGDVVTVSVVAGPGEGLTFRVGFVEDCLDAIKVCANVIVVWCGYIWSAWLCSRISLC